MPNSSNDNSSYCKQIGFYRLARDHAYVSEYLIVTPFYFVLGTLGHVILLWALCQQAKKHSAYYYQIFVAVSEMLEIFTYVIYIATFIWWSGVVHGGASWFTSCYPCMWYAAHLATPVANAFMTVTLLLSVCMAADRLSAVYNPFEYKLNDRRKRRILALITSALLGFATSVFDCFRFTVEIGQHQSFSYDVIYNHNFVNSDTGRTLAHLRNALRLFAMFSLISLNAMLIVVYRKKTRRVHPNNSAKGDEIDKTLIRLTVCQSILNFLSMSVLVGFYIAIYVVPRFYVCEALLWMPLVDAIWQITDMADFYVMLIVSKNIRKMVFTSLPFFKRFVLSENVTVSDKNEKA